MIVGTDISRISLLSDSCYISSAFEVDCLSLQLQNALLLVQDIVCFPLHHISVRLATVWRTDVLNISAHRFPLLHHAQPCCGTLRLLSS
jgi:hypothetical protein